MQNQGKNALVLTFFYSLQSMFAKSKHHHLNIVNMAFMKPKHGTCEARCRPLPNSFRQHNEIFLPGLGQQMHTLQKISVS